MEQVYEGVQEVTLQPVDGYQEVTFNDCTKLQLHIEVDKRRNAQVFLSYTGENMELDVEINVQEGSSLQLLFWNRLHGSLHMNQQVHLGKDAQAHIGIGDLQTGSSDYDINVPLHHSGSNVKLSSACLANRKHFEATMHHQVPYTQGTMEHFAIVADQGDYFMKASGVIDSGAQESVSHQATRVLTMSEKQKSEVVPLLLIDENDVKASHATTLGQPDENQLYYLQTRGLSRKQALGLLTIGYILPICEVIQNEECKKVLQAEIEEKVIANV